jgi:hypothetical protein
MMLNTTVTLRWTRWLLGFMYKPGCSIFIGPVCFQFWLVPEGTWATPRSVIKKGPVVQPAKAFPESGEPGAPVFEPVDEPVAPQEPTR